VGAVVVKSDMSNRAFWRLDLVEELLSGSDGKVRAAVVKVGNKSGREKTVFLKRFIKHLFPLEERANSPLSMRAEPVDLKLTTSEVHSDLGDSPPEPSDIIDPSHNPILSRWLGMRYQDANLIDK